MNIDRFLSDHLTIAPKFELPQGSAVVAGCDAWQFPGLQILYASLVKTHRDFAFFVFDLGMSRAQTHWLARNTLAVVLQLDVLKIPRAVESNTRWKRYVRPWLIEAVAERFSESVDCVLWLDNDCVIKGNLAPLFGHIDGMRAYVAPNIVRSPNDASVYEHFPVKNDSEDFALCSAVCGFKAGRKADMLILSTWKDLTARILENPSGLEEHFHNYDESVLRLVLQTLDAIEVVWPDKHWNYIVQDRRTTIEESLRDIRNRYPNEYILHFYGMPKYWSSTPLKEMLEMKNPETHH